MRIMHEKSMSKESVLSCSRLRKLSLQANEVKETLIHLPLWIQRQRLTQEGHNLLVQGFFPFHVEKMVPARVRVQSPAAFECHRTSAPEREGEKPIL